MACTGCVPMWWHRRITFPIDKSNNKEGCNAVRLVNAFFSRQQGFLQLPLETATADSAEEIQGADEGILVRPGSGTAQGSEGAADAIHSVYHKCIDQWSDHLRAELLQEALIFKPPPEVPDLFNSPVFMELTTCADVVRVSTITTEPVHT